MQLTGNELMIGTGPRASDLSPDVAYRITQITGDHHPFACNCDHKLQGTGAVFYQSVGLLYCTNCTGWQEIRQRVNY